MEHPRSRDRWLACALCGIRDLGSETPLLDTIANAPEQRDRSRQRLAVLRGPTPRRRSAHEMVPDVRWGGRNPVFVSSPCTLPIAVPLGKSVDGLARSGRARQCENRELPAPVLRCSCRALAQRATSVEPTSRLTV